MLYLLSHLLFFSLELIQYTLFKRGNLIFIANIRRFTVAWNADVLRLMRPAITGDDILLILILVTIKSKYAWRCFNTFHNYLPPICVALNLLSSGLWKPIARVIDTLRFMRLYFLFELSLNQLILYVIIYS